MDRKILIIILVVLVIAVGFIFIVFIKCYKDKLLDCLQCTFTENQYKQVKVKEKAKCDPNKRILVEDGFHIPVSVEAYLIQHKLHSCTPTTGQDERQRARSMYGEGTHLEQQEDYAKESKTRAQSLFTSMAPINESTTQEETENTNIIHRKSLAMTDEETIRRASAPVGHLKSISEGPVDSDDDAGIMVRKQSAPARIAMLRKTSYTRTMSPDTLDINQYKKSQSFIYKKGKVRFHLQFDTASKNRLLISLKEIEQKSDNDDVVYATITLLPVRSSVHSSLKQIYCGRKAQFKDRFYLTCITFPDKIDYSSHTILIKIFHANNCDEHEMIGEARYSLLNKDIYNGIPSNISLHINPSETSQNEIGDAEVHLKFSPETSQLVAAVVSVIFINEKSIKHGVTWRAEGVEIKMSLAKRQEKRKISKILYSNSFNEETSDSDIDSPSLGRKRENQKEKRTSLGKPICMQLSEQDFLLTTLTLNLSRGSFLSKDSGSVRIGSRSHGMCGKEHWRAVCDAPNTEIVMWHSVYD